MFPPATKHHCPQLALILPHMRVGEFVTGSPHMQVVKIHLSDLWKGHLAGDLLVGMFVEWYGSSCGTHASWHPAGLWHAILGWLLLVALEAAAVAVVTLPLFRYLKQRYAFVVCCGWCVVVHVCSAKVWRGVCGAGYG